jgi:hypothetical protein
MKKVRQTILLAKPSSGRFQTPLSLTGAWENNSAGYHPPIAFS